MSLYIDLFDHMKDIKDESIDWPCTRSMHAHDWETVLQIHATDTRNGY